MHQKVVLMLCFVVLTNILLLTSLIAILNQVFTTVCALPLELHEALSAKAGARFCNSVSIKTSPRKYTECFARLWTTRERSTCTSKPVWEERSDSSPESADEYFRYSVFLLEVSNSNACIQHVLGC